MHDKPWVDGRKYTIRIQEEIQEQSIKCSRNRLTNNLLKGNITVRLAHFGGQMRMKFLHSRAQNGWLE